MADKLFIIINNCFSSQHNTFTQLKEEIITNFNAIDLTECEINDLQKGKLIITRPRFRQHFRENFYNRLVFNKIVKKKVLTCTE